ncbi:hypothetical protein [Bacillus infantis]|uniref:hypothetical protein n=1 Tax=Bacillus infantis TaxID=324767 RepID=UPI003CED4433
METYRLHVAAHIEVDSVVKAKNESEFKKILNEFNDLFLQFISEKKKFKLPSGECHVRMEANILKTSYDVSDL